MKKIICSYICFPRGLKGLASTVQLCFMIGFMTPAATTCYPEIDMSPGLQLSKLVLSVLALPVYSIFIIVPCKIICYLFDVRLWSVENYCYFIY